MLVGSKEARTLCKGAVSGDVTCDISQNHRGCRATEACQATKAPQTTERLVSVVAQKRASANTSPVDIICTYVYLVSFFLVYTMIFGNLRISG